MLWRFRRTIVAPTSTLLLLVVVLLLLWEQQPQQQQQPPSALWRLGLPMAGAHQLGAHGLYGEPLSPTPHLPDITGAFELEVTVRWDDWSPQSQEDRSWQTVVEYSNADTNANAVWFGQVGQTNRVRLVVWGAAIGADSTDTTTPTTTTSYSFIEAEGIVADETAVWKVAVDDTGFLWLYKNNVLLNSVQGSTVPANLIRTNKLLGQSTLPETSSLYGAVLGLRLVNLSERAHLKDLDFVNLPGQMVGAFTVTFYSRLDDVKSGTRPWQKVFDFGNGPNEHNVWFGVEGNTDNAIFQLHLADGTTETLTAANVFVQGEWAHWHVGIDDHHVMYIEKNDVQVAYGTAPLAVLHSNTFRRHMLVGASHWTDDHHPLQGVVLGLRVDLHASS